MTYTKMSTRTVNGVDSQILTISPRPATNGEASVWQKEFEQLIEEPGKHFGCVIYLTESKTGGSYSFNEERLIAATAKLNLKHSNVISIGQQVIGAAKGNSGKNAASMGEFVGKTSAGLSVYAVKIKLALVKTTHIAQTKAGVEVDVLQGTYIPIVNFASGHVERTNAVIREYEDKQAARNVFSEILHNDSASAELKFRAAEAYTKIAPSTSLASEVVDF